MSCDAMQPQPLQFNKANFKVFHTLAYEDGLFIKILGQGLEWNWHFL